MASSLKRTREAIRPSSNWLLLQKILVRSDNHERSRQKRKLHHTTHSPSLEPSVSKTTLLTSSKRQTKNGESLGLLQDMIHGKLTYTAKQQQPGKYLALDCEMVGVGIDASESSLARVSLVNYHGATQLDVFVKQKERVVDYRTHVSGVREADMIDAVPFEQVQKQVADLLMGRILIGHALSNDLKALLLTHPRSQTQDTQRLAHRHKITRSPYPALRHLVQKELGVTIQGGEHSSVMDARATMALYRLHRKEWGKGQKPISPTEERSSRKRKRADKSDRPKERKESDEASSGNVSLTKKKKSSGLGVSTPKGSEESKRSAKPNAGPGKRVKKKKWWQRLG